MTKSWYMKKQLKLSEKEEQRLDMIAELLADDFLAKEAAGTLPKLVKREKKSVRK